LLILRPSGSGSKSWLSEPKQYKIDLLDEALKHKQLVILNLSKRSIVSIFHKDKKRISAGNFQAYGRIEGLALHRMVATYGEQNKMIYNTALRLNQANRLLLYILYNANPHTNDGRAVGVFRTSVDLGEAKLQTSTPVSRY